MSGGGVVPTIEEEPDESAAEKVKAPPPGVPGLSI